MTGTAAADAAGLGAVEYRAMQDAGYQKGYSAAVTGSSAIIGPIIPPSVPLIIYGILAQESIGALFIASIIPGFLMGGSLLVLCTYYAHKHGYEKGSWWSLSDIWASSKAAAPALGTPVLIIDGLLGGLFTATEAGAVALFYTLFVGYVFYGGTADDEDFFETTYNGLVTTSALTFIVATATLYGFLARRVQLPDALAEAVVGVTSEPVLLLFLIAGVLLVVGLMMETIAAITIS